MITLARNRRTLMGSEVNGQLVTADLRGALAYKAHFEHCRFVDTKMGKSSFAGSKFISCVFEGCEIAQCDFAAATLDDCLFLECDLDQTNFRSASIKKTRFSGGRAEYAVFENATLAQVKFDLQLHGADLRYASAVDVDYGDSNLWGCSINVSCSFFRGMAFDERSLRLFLALLGLAKGEPEFIRDVNALAGDQAIRMMTKLSEES